MTERELSDLLQGMTEQAVNAVNGASDLEAMAVELGTLAGADEGEVHVRSYAAAGLLTDDPGFVVELPDGSEYQVTVLRRR